MRLTILGNEGPYPSSGGACSSYLLESDSLETSILIDCGTGALQSLMENDQLNKLDAVILSHLHYDHMSDMLPMQYALQFNPRTKPLPVYAPGQPEGVRAMLKGPAYDLWPMNEVTIGEMRISFCAMRHPVESFGIRIDCDHKTFVYTGDTNTCYELEFFCDGADLLLADAGLSDEDYAPAKPHLSASLCGKLAKDARCQRLLLTHFNPKYDREILRKQAAIHYPKAELTEIRKTYYI